MKTFAIVFVLCFASALTVLGQAPASPQWGTNPWTFMLDIDTAPPTPGPIVGVTLTCPGHTSIYEVDTVPGATSYTWTLPSGWTGSSNTNSITTVAGNMGGIIYVTANNASGSSMPDSLGVSMHYPPSQPGPISGQTDVCAGMTLSYATTNVGSQAAYFWSLPSGWVGNSMQPTMSAITGASSGTISVRAQNSCGSSPMRTLAVTVHPQPVAAFSFTTQLLNASFTDLSSGAASWYWDFGSGGNSTQQSPNYTYNSPGTFNVCQIATGPGCADTACQWINVVAVGLGDASSMQVEVAPNPSTGIFQVVVSGRLSGQLVDGSSRVLDTYSWSPGTHTIDLSALPQGMYFLQLKGPKGQICRKLVKQ